MDLQELVRLIESGQHGAPFDVRVDEEEIVKLANERIGSLASDVSVDISPQSITVGAKTKIAAFAMAVRLIGKPVLENDRLRFDVNSMDLNQRPAPEFMRSQLSNAINEKLDPADLPVKISRLELGDHWLEVAGETR